MKQFLNLMPLLLLASCSSEFMDVAETKSNDNVEKVILRSKPFEYDDDTRTSLTAMDKGISFAWASYDALGVFPIYPETNNQAEQKLNVLDGADAHFATFDGAGWALNRKNTYAAYCPYNGKLPASTPYTAVPIDMTGQDGTLETIGKKYDYMYAPSSFVETTLSDGTPFEVVFDFKHAISIVQLKLTMPVAATWKSIKLSDATGRKVWTTNATMNVSDGTINSTVTSTSVSLELDNIVTTDNNKTLTLYVAALPTVIETLKLTATSSGDSKYVATLEGKKLQAGKAYRWTATLKPAFAYDGKENGHEWIDLGLSVKWAAMNVGATTPDEYGNYYAWGETEPQSKRYHWNTYKWYNGSDNYAYDIYQGTSYTKYGSSDGKTTLEAEDDAASVNWGGAWRMPTDEECQELVDNCYCVRTSNYSSTGVAGYIVYKAKLSSDKGQVITSSATPSGNYSLSDTHIFLPEAGYYYGSYPDSYESTKTSYCSSSLASVSHASVIELWKSTLRVSLSRRCDGMSVRAVCKK